MNNLNIYMSEWGEFSIPNDIFEKSCITKGTKDRPIVEVIEGIESRHFWNWLNDQEILAGKRFDE
jgi:hypothetical protein